MSSRDVPGDVLPAMLSLRGNLWGREKQLAKLEELASKVHGEDSGTTDSKQVAFVHGPSGSGKTSICNALKRRFPSHRFLFGKFDQYQDNSAPYSTLVQAFEGSLIVESDDTTVGPLQPEIISEKVGSEAYRVLCELVPSFSPTASEISEEQFDDQDHSSKLMMAAELLAIAVTTFLSAIACEESPAVLVMDDLQWADEDSLVVLNVIIQSPEVKNLLLLGIYRDDDEETMGKPLVSFLGTNHGMSHVHSISVRNLDQANAFALVADVLSIDVDSPDQTYEQLVKLIFRKTLGNPYFIVQFLSMLYRSGLLKFNFATEKWQWDLATVQEATSVADNVVVMLTHAVQSIPLSTLNLLQLASCLGYVFDVDLLKQIFELSRTHKDDTCKVFRPFKDHGESKDNMEQEGILSFSSMLKRLVEENFLQPSGKNLYRFTHAVYELVPSGKQREELHWYIGKYIEAMITSEPKARAKFLFLAADQLNRGSSCIGNEDERIGLMRLNCDAAHMATQRNGLDFIGLFLNKALDLMNETDWETSYELILNIHNKYVFLQASGGRYEEGIEKINVILERAKRQQDTIVALMSRAKIRTSQLHFQLALCDAKKALRLCGERLPIAHSLSVSRELNRAKRMIRDLSDEDLLRPTGEVTDDRKKLAMKTYLTTAICGWQLNHHLIALSFLGMFRATCKYGRSIFTGTGFTSFGALLATNGDVEMAYRFADLGLRAQKPEDTRPDTSMPAYCSVLHAKLPLASLVEPCLLGYRKGLEMGNTFYGSIAMGVYADAYKGCGLPLDTFASDLNKFASQLKILRCEFMLCFILPTMQLALNLTGQSVDPVKVTWDVITKHGHLNDGVDPSRSPKAELQREFTQAFNAYILRDVHTAEMSLKQLCKKPRRKRRYEMNHFNNYFFALTEGLVGFWLGKEKQTRWYRRFALSAIKWFQKRRNLNTVPLVLLLEAQKAATESSVDYANVRKLYDNVIVMLARSGQIHYGAIANEQAGEFLLGHDDSIAAIQYFESAAQLYQEWGASIKAQDLIQKHSLRADRVDSIGTTLRGRERFSSRKDSAGLNDSAKRDLIQEQ